MTREYIATQCGERMKTLSDEYDNITFREDITPKYRRVARCAIKKHYQVLALVRDLASGKEIEDEDAIEAFYRLLD